MNTVVELKKAAAEHAVQFIESGMIIGLGTGSTAYFAINKVAELIKQNSLKDIFAIPSSKETESLARSLGIPLTTFKENISIDIAIDGADEVDENLNLIKGGGGALLREKIVVQAAKQFLVVVDYSKISKKLGNKFKVPVEVIPFALECETFFLKNCCKDVLIRKNNDGTIFVTDEGNYILDADFGEIEDPATVASMLNERAGIVEHGLFIGLASAVYAASPGGIITLRKFN